MLAIVDVLSFSTAAITVVYYRGIIYPCTQNEDIAGFAQHIGGEAAVHRRHGVTGKGRFSLSPSTFVDIE